MITIEAYRVCIGSFAFSAHCNISSVEHVQKYEAMDWTSQNSIKSIFCYKIAISWNSGLKLSELVNLNSINDIASSKWENLHLKQRNDKKVTSLLFYPMCEM